MDESQYRQRGPTLVLVRHDPADRHIDYVSNHPSLAEPLLIGRMPADSRTSEEETARLAAEAFPDRMRILFDAATGQYFQASLAESGLRPQGVCQRLGRIRTL